MQQRDPMVEARSGPVACSDCGRPAELAISAGDTNRRLTEAGFDYYRCTACGLWFLWPVPENLSAYYPLEYYAMPASLDELRRIASRERHKLKMLGPDVRGGRLLEIGPAAGAFAFLAKEAGFEVETVEMDARCCDYLRGTVGVRATCSSDVVGALQGAGPYDAAMLWHVAEHLEHPRASLEAVASVLRPGGVLVLAMPNPESFQFKVLGRHWTHLDAPRHLNLVPIDTLKAWLEQAGMATGRVTTQDRIARGYNAFGWYTSAKNHFRSPIARRVASTLGWIVSCTLAPWEHTGLRGSCYAGTFFKRG